MVKYLAGEASVEETQELNAWIAASKENEREFQSIKKVFDVSDRQLKDKKSSTINVDIDQEWQKFTESVQNRKIRPLKREQKSFGWLRIAAAILILVTAGLMIDYLIYKTSDTHYQTAGETRVIDLPDGSKVTLNQRSLISHSSAFNEENRTIELKGEAFFEVAENSSLPFIIRTKDGTVEVVGTTFNVRSYDSLETVEVVVETGVVLFSVPSVKTLELNAGKKAIYQKQTRQLTSAINDDVNFRSWSTRRLVFVDTPLRDVLETINKTYGTNISLSSDASDSCIVTVTFDQQSLDAVLRVLENTLNLTIRRDGTKTEIISDGC